MTDIKRLDHADHTPEYTSVAPEVDRCPACKGGVRHSQDVHRMNVWAYNEVIYKLRLEGAAS